MSDTIRWIIAVSVIVVLIVVFTVSFILYQKTPLPKGCEDMIPDEEKCKGCKDTHCHLNIYAKNHGVETEETNKEEK